MTVPPSGDATDQAPSANAADAHTSVLKVTTIPVFKIRNFTRHLLLAS
jgi:hypothetical protein